MDQKHMACQYSPWICSMVPLHYIPAKDSGTYIINVTLSCIENPVQILFLYVSKAMSQPVILGHISCQHISEDLLSVCLGCGKARCVCRVDDESDCGWLQRELKLALPTLDTDLLVNGTYPPAVEAFWQEICEADCYLFASPECNYSVTGPLKNAIDWASRPPNVWADKAAAIVSAGGGFGGGLAQYHLRQFGVYLDLHFINKPKFSLKAFQPLQSLIVKVEAIINQGKISASSSCLEGICLATPSAEFTCLLALTMLTV